MAIERDASSRPRGPYRGFCAQQSIRDIRSARPSSSSRRIIALVWSPLGNPRSRHERVAPAHVQYVRNKPAQKGRRETGGRKRHSELTNVERTKERKGEKKKEKKKRERAIKHGKSKNRRSLARSGPSTRAAMRSPDGTSGKAPGPGGHGASRKSRR